MTFDEKIFLAVDDIEVPDSLSPENMELMLTARRVPRKQTVAVSRKALVSASSGNITVTHNITNKRKDAAFKITASIAACFVLLTGVFVYRNTETEKPGLVDIVKYADIPAPQIPASYTELYDVYTSLQLDDTGKPKTKTPFDFSLSDTDIVKTDNGFIYTLRDGALYIINPEQSEIVATIPSSAHPPVEMYVTGGNLFLISNELSVSENVFIEIYDVGEPSNPVKLSDYSQCGRFTSGKVADGRLVLVSSYSDYRLTPLEGEADLAGFVPYYTVNSSSYFIDADSIYVPANASSTDYTVISAIDCYSPDKITVKAVLGSGGDAYCTDDSLYVYGKGQGNYTVISKFNLVDSEFEYSGSCSIDGLIPGRNFLNETDNTLKVITAGYDADGNVAQNVYLLDRNMNVTSTLGAILPGEAVTDVKFADSFVFFYTGTEAAFVVNTDVTPIASVPELKFVKGSIYAFGDKLISFGRSDEGGYLLSLYSTNGILLNSYSFASDEGNVYSSAEADMRAVYIDDDGYVGIPVHSFDEFGTNNSYYIFKISDETINLETILNYSDIDDANIFERAIRVKDTNADGDKIAVLGGSRIVWVRMSDWKVLSAKDFFTR
ncbi:MAG: beta-propeller domain-containing protein [Ruminococcus sp.]|jgi:hypothetical protein|nr:beta-propeller domain-containing protein [Ruminococcus sp.]